MSDTIRDTLTPAAFESFLLLKAINKNNDGDREASKNDYLLITDLLTIQQQASFLTPKRGTKKRWNKSILQVMEARINKAIIKTKLL